MINKLMSLFGRKAATGKSNFKDPQPWFQNAFTLGTSSGVNVNTTLALTIPAYFAALRIIGEDVAKLPLTVYERVGDNNRRIATEHPLFPLLSIRPNPDMTSLSFRRTVTHQGANYGTGYAEIERNGFGVPIALNPIHPSRVTPRRNTAGTLVYDVQIPTASREEISRIADRDVSILRIRQENMLNISSIGGNGITGYPIISLAAETLGISIAQQRFAGKFYSNGAHMSGVLEHPAALSTEAKQRLREEWVNKYQGVENAHDVILLEEGMTWKQLGIDPKAAQFLEGQIFSVQNIARWFRIAPHKLQENSRATFSNIESENAHHYDALLPYMISWEQEVNHKLLDNGVRFFVEHNTTSLLRGDMAARANFHRTMFMIGAMTQNEIRGIENMNSRDDADTLFVPLNMRPSDEPVSQNTGTSNATTQAVKDIRAEAEIFKPMFNDCADRLVKKEIRALSRHSKKAKKDGGKSELNSWLDKFYSEHIEYIVESFEPIISSFSVSCLSENINIDLHSWAVERSTRLKAMVNNAFDNEEHPNEEIEYWTDFAVNQMVKEVMEISIREIEEYRIMHAQKDRTDG